MNAFFALGILMAAVVILSWLATFGSRWFARRFQAIDRPTGGRKIHKKNMPLWGGVGIAVVIILFYGILVFLYRSGWETYFYQEQLVGFILALVVLLIVGMLDDRYDLSPWIRFPIYACACLIVMLTGTSIEQVTRLTGQGGMTLGFLEWPVTFVWLFGVTLTMKILDGLDGLVTGQTVIGAGLIAALALTPAYFQPPVAVLAVIIGAAYLGFLPVNMNPAKQFLGESGSVIAGFSLAFLAIVSGTKVATALMAIGLPLADASFVLVGRMLRGVSPFRGDDTHLHFKLLKAGLSQRWAVFTLWMIALAFGVVALGLQTRGKVLLLIGLLVLTILLSYFSSLMRRSRIPRV